MENQETLAPMPRTKSSQKKSAHRRDLHQLNSFLKRTRVTARLRLRKAVKSYVPSEEGAFSDLIAAMQEVGVSQQELARHFKVAPSTVARWASGKAAPATYARGFIVKTLADFLVDHE